MLANYLKVFFRHFFKHKLFTAINVLGLAAGLVACILIGLFVQHELTYDRYHAQSSSTYRLSMANRLPDGSTRPIGSTFAPIAALLKREFQQITETARLAPRRSLLARGELVFYEDDFRFADNAFFKLFDHRWLLGRPEEALLEPGDVVLTESLARKYFGEENPLGQTMTLESRLPLRVSGVIADLPSNTHITGSAFGSLDLLEDIVPNGEGYLESWFYAQVYTYFQLQQQSDIQAVERLLPALRERYFPAAGGEDMTLHATPITKMHFHENGNTDMKPAGSRLLLVVFSSIAISILLVAVINFVNLSTARASLRMREVGLRKSLGGRKAQLIGQFLGESLLLSGAAMLIALALVELLRPIVEAELEMDLSAGLPGSLSFSPMLAGSTLVLGLLAGTYPAFYLSAFKIANVLRGAPSRGGLIRQCLVVVQFAAAIMLVVASMVQHLQMRHITQQDPGFDRSQIVVVAVDEQTFRDKWQSFRNRLLEHPSITQVTSSRTSPLRPEGRMTYVRSEPETAQRLVPLLPVDARFFETYGIRLLHGRLFDAALRTDRMDTALPLRESLGTGSLVINESAAREFGWSPEESLGKLIEQDGQWVPVIGVVNDTVASYRTEASPILYVLPLESLAGGTIAVRISGDVDSALAQIDSAWLEVSPGEPINRYFLEERSSSLYDGERRQMRLVLLFTGLCVLIAGLGLYGLAAFSTERRTTEIGVRKVMGGSVWSIVLLFTQEFSKLVLLANLIAWPIAYFAMSRWLENFAYRIDLSPLLFIGSGAIALCIAWVTVGGTAAKAASAKPVLALRYE